MEKKCNMDNNAIKRMFDFLEDNENKNKPFKWKLVNNEPLTEDDLNIKGDLSLYNSNITSLPEGLKVGGYLYIHKTPLKKYTDEELRDMVKPGFIKGKIIR